MSENPFPDESPRRRFHFGRWLLVVLVLVIAVGVWEQYKGYLERVGGPGEKKAATQTIRVWALGASETYGMGAGQTQSWPMQFVVQMDRLYPAAKWEARNLATAGVNTAEAIQFLKAALRKVVDGEPSAAAGDDQFARPNYAFICLGVNNIWNLHAAADLLATADPATPGLQKAMRTMHVARPHDLATTPRQTYYRLFSGEGGWRVYFKDFNDPFLAGWVKKDLQTIAATLKENRIKPIFMTYYFDYFPELNTLIRKFGPEIGVPVVDVERTVNFLVENKWVLAQADTVHLNKDGYAYVAQQVAQQFMPLLGQ